MKKLLAMLLAVIMMLSMVACGGGDESTGDSGALPTPDTVEQTDPTPTPEQQEAPKDYTFANGVYETELFSVTVPNGWVIKESTAGAERVMLLRTASADSYDVFKEAQIEIFVRAFAFAAKDDPFNLDGQVKNDEQFFKDKNPTVEDITVCGYTGKVQTGPSFAYNGATACYINADLWQGDSNNKSRMDIDSLYYDDAQKADLDAIMNSLVCKLAPQGEVDTAPTGGDAQTFELTGCIVTVPNNDKGWVVESSSERKVELKSTTYNGTFSITCNSVSGGNTAEVWANTKSGNFNPAPEVSKVEIAGNTYYTYSPVDGQVFYFADSSDGALRIEAKTMFINAEQIADIMEAMVIK